MRALSTKTNVTAPGGDYPYGRAKDNPGDNSGTPVNELLLGDAMQFFEALMDEAGVSPNGLPENSSDGFQLFEALQALLDLRVAKTGDTMTGDLNFSISGAGSSVIGAREVTARRNVSGSIREVKIDANNGTITASQEDGAAPAVFNIKAPNGNDITAGGQNIRVIGGDAKAGAAGKGGNATLVVGAGDGAGADGQLKVESNGSEPPIGSAVLVGGTVTINRKQVTANTIIIAFTKTPGGTPGWLQVSARVAGTSFTILSSSGADTSTVGFIMFEP